MRYGALSRTVKNHNEIKSCGGFIFEFCVITKILGRLDQLGSLRRKSTAHLKHLISTRQSCKSIFVVVSIFTNDYN